MNAGILVGCDETQEWLLSWWWEHFTAHNNIPVTFIDFGMSKASLSWCASKGDVIPLSSSLIPSVKTSLSEKRIAEWENQYGKEVWQARCTWFKKPEALLLTPYEKTLWIDLDCEVLGSLEPLFAYADGTAELAIAREPNKGFDHEHITYNSGVIAYHSASSLVKKWAEQVPSTTALYLGDQDLLSALIATEKPKIYELPPEYNWRMSQGLNLNALIIHWAGTWGKTYIKTHGGLAPFLKAQTRTNQ